jgi:hypothetical protein
MVGPETFLINGSSPQNLSPGLKTRMGATRGVIVSLALWLPLATAVPDVVDSVFEQDDACTDTAEGTCSVELRQLRASSADAAIQRHDAADESEKACYSFNTHTATCQYQQYATSSRCYSSSHSCELGNPGAGNCGPTGAPTCAGPSENCFYDPTCSTGNGLYCNAGGKGQNCRFCGGSGQMRCPGRPAPTPAPTPPPSSGCWSVNSNQLCAYQQYATNSHCYTSAQACSSGYGGARGALCFVSQYNCAPGTMWPGSDWSKCYATRSQCNAAR